MIVLEAEEGRGPAEEKRGGLLAKTCVAESAEGSIQTTIHKSLITPAAGQAEPDLCYGNLGGR